MASASRKTGSSSAQSRLRAAHGAARVLAERVRSTIAARVSWRGENLRSPEREATRDGIGGNGTQVGASGGMLPLLKRHEIQVLLRAGHSQRDVAERTGASADTVRRVRDETAVTTTDDTAARRERKIGRPSKAIEFAPKVRAWLAEAPELPTQELLRRATEAGYTGHKTAFYALVAGVRPPRTAPVVRFEGLPGELAFEVLALRRGHARRQRAHRDDRSLPRP